MHLVAPLITTQILLLGCSPSYFLKVLLNYTCLPLVKLEIYVLRRGALVHITFWVNSHSFKDIEVIWYLYHSKLFLLFGIRCAF